MFMIFCSVFGLFLFTAMNFRTVFGTVPMFLNIIGIVAIILYLAINVFSLKGDQNGF
jgi:hypothetical protein